MSATIPPVGAYCAVDEHGRLLPETCQHYRHNIMVPTGRRWRIVAVVIDPDTSWAERDEAAKAIDALPDCVACALLGVDENAPMEDVP